MSQQSVHKSIWKLAAVLFILAASWCLLPAHTARADGITVTTTYPVSNTLNVTTTTNISVTFSHNISATTVTSHSFAVRGLQSGLVTGMHSVINDDTIIVTPTNAFHAGEVVLVNASSQIESSDGITLTPYAWQFTVDARHGDSNGTAWWQKTVDADFNEAISVYAADVDGDGDLDVLGAAYGADDIAWWENMAGDGTAWAEHSVDVAFDGAFSVYAADVDGDGDLDVLGTAIAADDITVWLNVATEIAVYPLSLVFGDQDVDAGATVSQPVTITNNGAVNLHISSVSLTGADVGEFAIESDSGETTLTLGDTRIIQISFDPSTTGTKSASLTIQSDDSDNGTVNVTLGGTGTSVGQPGYGSTPAPGSSINVGMTNVGSTVSTTLTINETGEATLVVTPTLNGVDAADFGFAPTRHAAALFWVRPGQQERLLPPLVGRWGAFQHGLQQTRFPGVYQARGDQVFAESLMRKGILPLVHGDKQAAALVQGVQKGARPFFGGSLLSALLVAIKAGQRLHGLVQGQFGGVALLHAPGQGCQRAPPELDGLLGAEGRGPQARQLAGAGRVAALLFPAPRRLLALGAGCLGPGRVGKTGAGKQRVMHCPALPFVWHDLGRFPLERGLWTSSLSILSG